MTIGAVHLLDEFGRAAEIGNAALFVGAGLSRGEGLPDWGELLQDVAEDAEVPLSNDLPLVAEYIVLSGRYTHEQLAHHIRGKILACEAQPGVAHQHLKRLPLDQVWTTNYDSLIEDVCTDSHLVVNDDDVTEVGGARRAVIKMHGSIDAAGWAHSPIITRKDFETYRLKHPRMWALLRATYLSRTMLFLGFSFADPNIDILLQLARTLGTSVGDRHMTVMRRPEAPEEVRQHEFRVQDLQDSGVRVHEIAEFSDLEPLLAGLVRRTRGKRLFVSGSFKGDLSEGGMAASRAMATQFGRRHEWKLVSLAGDSGWHVSQQAGLHARANGRYDAGQFEFHFRKSTEPVQPMKERLGVAFHHDKSREELGPELLDECRAMLVIGGGARTREEIDWARRLAVPVVPIGTPEGTAAANYWQEMRRSPPTIGGAVTAAEEWERLGHENVDVAAAAALDLLDRAMYHTA